MTSVSDDRYTVVQHSGYGYAEDPQFRQALETRRVSTAAEARKIERAGGLVLSYEEAERFAEKAMYPPDAGNWLIPAAQGTFADLQVDGLAVYLPVREVVG
jgi:hypothetical protein